MSIIKNLGNVFVPVRERREVSGTIAALNAEVVLPLNGDASVTIQVDGGGGTFNSTFVIEGSIDGTIYGALPAYPIPSLCNAGTIPPAAQPAFFDALNAASARRAYVVAVGGLKSVRVRISNYTAGSAAVVMNADTNETVNPYVRDQKSSTLMISATAAVGVAATATLPAVAGLRHYIDSIRVIRSATAALTAAATPVLVTTTNLPGAPALTFGQDVAGIGIDKEVVLDFGGAGLGATLVGTATTIVCPVYTGVIWRINVSYRLGL